MGTMFSGRPSDTPGNLLRTFRAMFIVQGGPKEGTTDNTLGGPFHRGSDTSKEVVGGQYRREKGSNF